MKKGILFLLLLALSLSVFGCGEAADGSVFQGEVIEIQEGGLLVKPAPESMESRSADRIWVSLEDPEIFSQIQLGDRVEITYSGGLQETYPAVAAGVESVRKVG